MTRIVAFIAVVAIAAVAAPAYPFGLSDLNGMAHSVTGGSAAVGATAAQLTLATSKFLSGSAKLAEATGDVATAKQCTALLKKAQQGDTVDTSDIYGKMEKLADNQQKLQAADTSKVRAAAVDVGIASLIQAKAVAEISQNPKAMAGSPGSAMALVTVAPANLKSMVTVQGALYSYLRAKGENPEAEAKKAAAALGKS